MEHPLVGRSRVRSSARTSQGASERALSNVSIYLVRRRPRSSVFLNQMLIHSFIHSFALCSLIAQKSIQGNVQKCHKEEEKRKEEKEVRLETERRRKERANVCPIGIH